LAGLWGEVALASQLITQQMIAFSFMVPLGISVAASVKVGNYLGANDPEGARRVAYVCLYCVWVTCK
jgi:MATE family multidrug resistance protein